MGFFDKLFGGMKENVPQSENKQTQPQESGGSNTAGQQLFNKETLLDLCYMAEEQQNRKDMLFDFRVENIDYEFLNAPVFKKIFDRYSRQPLRKMLMALGQEISCNDCILYTWEHTGSGIPLLMVENDEAERYEHSFEQAGFHFERLLQPGCSPGEHAR